MGSKNKKTKKAIIATIAAEPEPKATHGGGNKRGNNVITDARFAFSQTDPRFQKHTKQKSKVTIDSRFNRMFTDKNFSTSSTSIDKRGKAKRKDTPNPLKHYYHMDEDEDKDEEEEEVKERNEEVVNDKDEIDKSSDEGEKERENKLEKVWEKLKDSEDEDSESGSELEGVGDEDDDVTGDSDSDSDFDSDDEVYSEEEQEEEHVPEIDKETSRLAVVNMDWNQVNAVDLYVLLSSFLPKGGQISSVSVYPSEFGLKRMEEEAVHGPVGLFEDDKKKNEDDNSDDGDDKIDNENLRAYELSRLRYYYAVVECDSIATADYLYKTCDGVEFERSSNKLDLRFIPDSMEFKHAPRDVAKEAPANYEGVDFQTRALQQSKIELTWDDDEPQRSKTLKRKFNADQLAELELKEFLASDESDSDEDEDDDTTGDRSGKRQKKQDMYRALIQSGDGSDGDEEEEGQDMEVTFNTGLEDISKKILERRDKKSETVWEAYQRRKKEKKKARKNRSKDSSDDDSDTDQEPTEEPNDFFVEEPTAKEHKKARGKSGKKKKEVVETAEEEASRAELELLLADDNGETTGVKGYNLKRKKGKGKKGKDNLDEEKIPTVDYDDDRFSSLFTSHLFALDPTDPQYIRSAAHARQIAQKKRMEESNKQNGKTHVPSEVGSVKDEPVQAGDSSTKKEKFELSSLVKSIKLKSKKVPVPSNGKMSGRKGK